MNRYAYLRQRAKKLGPERIAALTRVRVLSGDCRSILQTLSEASVDEIVSSPPFYQQRDYDIPNQIGTELTVEEYLANLVGVFALARPLLKVTGTLWLVMGDSSANFRQACERDRWTGVKQPAKRVPPGYKTKDLILSGPLLALALQRDGWWLRSEIVWQRPQAIPDPTVDRVERHHFKIYLLARSPRYWFNGRLRDDDGKPFTDIWSGFARNKPGEVEGHGSTFPVALAERMVKLGCPPGGLVLDPFAGTGSTGVAAVKLGCRFIGIEQQTKYAELTRRRLRDLRDK